MTREQNQLLKKIKTLTPDEIARMMQFVEHLKATELHAVPPDLRAVPAPTAQDEQATQFDTSRLPVRQEDASPSTGSPAGPVSAAAAAAGARGPAVRPEASVREIASESRSPEAEIARAACAQWRRRPFQTIDADDLQPIAALFREAVDTRAANRFKVR